MGDDPDSHELLAVVAAVHHERIGEALDDGALCLAESFGGIPTGGVREVDGLADLDVIAKNQSQRGSCDSSRPAYEAGALTSMRCP